jgi:hypothetical protein
LKQWGHYLRLNPKRKNTAFEDVAADIEIRDDSGEKQIIPMFGKISRVSIAGTGDVDVVLNPGFSLPDKRKKELHLQQIEGNMLFDVRDKPVQNHFKTKDEYQLTKSWLEGVGAFSNN